MIKKTTIGLLMFFIVYVVFADESNKKNENPTALKRPTVGLVLSGGGAKGFAYIGFFKVLDEVNMPVDFIGGSSMGAITAALYSAGYSPETMQKLVKQQNWSEIINDTQERQYISYEEKLFGDKYIYSVPIGDKGVSLSKSITSSFNIDMLLNNLFLPVGHITDFNKLPIPFLCIGTDLLTGEAIVLNKGNLARAVRASMAIPGYFSPTYYDGRYLVDGGVVNNYPAEQVKAMGADIIIGGDVQAGLTDDIKKLNSITSILDQVVSYYRVDANVKGRELTDLYINFPMEYGMMDFSEYDSIIAIGEKIAREHYVELKALADSINSIEKSIERMGDLAQMDSILIDSVIWPDINEKQKERFSGYFDEILNTKSSISHVNEQLFLINGTKTFDDFHSEFISDDAESFTLKLEAENNVKGSLSAGIHYDNTYHGSVLLNASLRNVNRGNSKFFIDAVLSQYPRLKSLFIINNGIKPGFGLESDFYSLGFKEYEEGNTINNWHFNNFTFGTFMPMTIRNNFMLKLGIRYEVFQFKQDVVVDPELDAFREYADYGNFYLSFNHDSRDKINFTNKGQFVELKAKQIVPVSSKWDDNFWNGTILYLKYSYYTKLGERLVFNPELFAGYTFAKHKAEQLPENDGLRVKIPSVQHLFGFGGLNPANYVENHIPFTGLKFIESFGLYAGKVSTKFQYNVYKKFYVTAMVDFGLNEMELYDLEEIDWLFGYGLKFSYESFIGPVEFSVMSSNIDTSISSFINLGFWF